MTELPLAKWTEQARRDDWHQTFVGSDIRQMLAEIERLQASYSKLQELAMNRRDEIERLRAAYHNAESNVLVLSGEVERLRSENEDAKEAYLRKVAEIERLEATLRPFADFDTEDFKDEMRMFSDVPSPTIGDFRRARAALARREGK